MSVRLLVRETIRSHLNALAERDETLRVPLVSYLGTDLMLLSTTPRSCTRWAVRPPPTWRRCELRDLIATSPQLTTPYQQRATAEEWLQVCRDYVMIIAIRFEVRLPNLLFE
jgi:hypothetical protein